MSITTQEDELPEEEQPLSSTNVYIKATLAPETAKRAHRWLEIGVLTLCAIALMIAARLLYEPVILKKRHTVEIDVHTTLSSTVLKQKQLRLLRLEREMIAIRNQLRKIKSSPQVKQSNTNKIQHVPLEWPTQLNEKRFHFPRICWMYVQNITAESWLTQQLISRTEATMKEQGWELFVVGSEDWNEVVGNRNQQQLGFVLADLWHRAYETNDTSNIKDHTFNMKKQMISLILLAESGGLLLDKDILLTQNLTWIEDIPQKLVNRGQGTPHVIGFHYANYSASAEQVDLGEQSIRKLLLYPSLDPYFLAVSLEGRKFIRQWLQQYYLLVENPQSIKPMLRSYQLHLHELQGNDAYYEAFFIAGATVIRRKQLELDGIWLSSEQKGYRPLAIDYYGIQSINRLYGPLRYRLLFSDQLFEDIYFYFSKMHYTQLFRLFGQPRFLTILPFQWKLEQFALQALNNGSEKYSIFTDSFFHHFLFPNETISSPLAQRKFAINSFPSVWSSLPRYIWVHVKNASNKRAQQLCLINLQKAAKESKFQLRIMTDGQQSKWLSANTLRQIRKASEGEILKMVAPQVKLDLIQLALIKEHGGVSIRMPIITMQNFDWLFNFTSNPLFNGRGYPQLFMTYHPLFGRYPWNIDESSRLSLNLKSRYLWSLIACVKESQIVQKWYNDFLNNLLLQAKSLEQKMSGYYGITSFNAFRHHQQIASHTLGGILKSLTNSPDIGPRGFWQLNGFQGPQKLKQFTNYERGYDLNNEYLWDWGQSAVREMLGGFKFYLSLNDKQQKYLQTQLQKNGKFHPNSFIQNYLISYLSTDLQQQKMSSIPALVWIWNDFKDIPTNWPWLDNIRYYSDQFQIQLVGAYNYKEFLKDDQVDQLSFQLTKCNEAQMKRLLLMAILTHRGGISIQQPYLLAQQLNWVLNFSTPQAKSPELVAFSEKNLTAEKCAVISDLFIAVRPNSTYLKLLLKNFIPRSNEDNAQNILINAVKSIGCNQSFNIALMPRSEFVDKLQYLSENVTDKEIYTSLAEIQEEELIGYTGPLRYILNLPSSDVFVAPAHSKIIEGSLVARLLYQNKADKLQPRLKALKSLSEPPKWQSLPKIVWIYRSMIKSHNFAEEWFQKKVAQKVSASGMMLMQVDAATISNYLGIQNQNAINLCLLSYALPIPIGEVRSLLHKIALLKQHGGLIIPQDYMPLDDLLWLQVPSLEQPFLYNNYGDLPQIMGYFNLPRGHYTYNVDARYGLKTIPDATLSLDWLASVPDSLFLGQIFDVMLKCFALSQTNFEDYFTKAGQILSKPYTLSMIVSSIQKLIIKRKTLELAQGDSYSALEYYRIWGMHPDIGPNKYLGPEAESQAAKIYMLDHSQGSQFTRYVTGTPRHVIWLTQRDFLELRRIKNMKNH